MVASRNVWRRGPLATRRLDNGGVLADCIVGPRGIDETRMDALPSGTRHQTAFKQSILQEQKPKEIVFVIGLFGSSARDTKAIDLR